MLFLNSRPLQYLILFVLLPLFTFQCETFPEFRRNPPASKPAPGKTPADTPADSPVAPAGWQVRIDDPVPGVRVAIPGNRLVQAAWWPAVKSPYDLAFAVASDFGEPGDLRRKEWTMLYILMARLAGEAPGNGVVGSVTGQDYDWRVTGYYEEILEDDNGRITGRKRIHLDRVISGSIMSKNEFSTFCRWRYGNRPW
jgi:hypothetical protein